MQDWDQLWEAFHRAREATPSDRAVYLVQLASSNPELVQRLEALLLAEQESGNIFERLVSEEFTLLKEFGNSETESILPDEVLSGRFRIVKQIGRGGMGTVYEA